MKVWTEAHVEIARPAEAVFDHAVDPLKMPGLFVGYGPIPGIREVEIEGGGPPRAGVLRRVTNSDGSVVEEELVALARPHRQAYRLLRGFRPPFSWLVRAGEGEWTFTSTDSGTEVSWRFGFELTTSLAWPLASVLLHTAFRAAMRRCLLRLREQVADAR